jgi:hypothetical protein
MDFNTPTPAAAAAPNDSSEPGAAQISHNIETILRVKKADGAEHAAASGSDRNHPAAFVKDSEITTKVKAHLGEEKVSSENELRSTAYILPIKSNTTTSNNTSPMPPLG